MFAALDRRAGHYLLLLAAGLALTLPHLGTHSLWDIDEGLNAEAAREMLEGGEWVVPTFNFELRSAKPALLYWLQMVSYSALGVGEFAARLPSVLASLLSVLLTYELGRRMFDPATGLLGGLVLAGSLEFCVLAHAATPDSVLLACLMLAFLSFWCGFTRRGADGTIVLGGHGWFVPFGLATGLAALAKGPIGLGLPALSVGLFLLREGRLKCLLDRRLLLGGLAFLVVALPWYVLVGVETRGEFLRDFFLKHNIGRARAPMEGHRGPIYYHALSLLVCFAPWSVFLAPTVWHALGRMKGAESTSGAGPAPSFQRSAYRLLACWFGVCLAVFSVAATKLPNYVLPLYPALALATAGFLTRWRRGEVRVGGWAWAAALAGLLLIGGAVAGGLWIASGRIALPGVRHTFAGLERWAGLGLLPILTALAAGWAVRRQRRGAAVAAVTAGGLLFTAMLAAFPPVTVDMQKAPRALVEAAGVRQPEHEIRVACIEYDYFQPSLVFYCRRKVEKLQTEEQVREFLASPLPSYLFVSARVWGLIAQRVPAPHRLAGRHWDMYRNCEVVVVTNR